LRILNVADRITVTFDSAKVRAALERLAESLADPSPVLKAIGEQLVESTRRRFDTGVAPDGTPWLTNKKAPAGKKPLIDTGDLMRTINFQIDGDTLYVGTDRFSEEWEAGAAVLQFGTTRAGRGNNTTIPARPFLGLSQEDEDMIDETVMDYLSGLLH
jgi:phage virion morphogenesis protein